MPSLPTTIKALQSTATKGQPSKFEVVSLPFSSRKDIAELDPDSVIVSRPSFPPSDPLLSLLP